MTVTEPKQPQYNDQTIRLSRGLQQIARDLDRALARTAGGTVLFSLIVWSNKPGGRMQYVSNTARPDTIKALEEMIARWKEGMPDVPAHEVQ